MPFSTDEFKAQITTGLANPSTWKLSFEFPEMALTGTEVADQLQGVDRELSFLCNQAVVPGRHFATNEININGPIRKMPYQSIYDDLQVSIYCRTEMKERHLFEAWQKMIHSNESHPDRAAHSWGYMGGAGGYAQKLKLTCYSPIAPNNLLRSIEDRIVDDEMRGEVLAEMFSDPEFKMMETYEVIFEDAYPMNIQPLSLDWSTKDQVMNLPITFAFRKWTARRTDFTVQEATPEPRPTGPSWGEILDGITRTIDTIDLYTGAIPSWMTTASRNLNPSGLSGLNQALGAKTNLDNFY
jgi:hypothetical protein